MTARTDPWAHSPAGPALDAGPGTQAFLLGTLLAAGYAGWKVLTCTERDAAFADLGGLDDAQIVASDTKPGSRVETAWADRDGTRRLVDLVDVVGCAHLVPAR